MVQIRLPSTIVVLTILSSFALSRTPGTRLSSLIDARVTQSLDPNTLVPPRSTDTEFYGIPSQPLDSQMDLLQKSVDAVIIDNQDIKILLNVLLERTAFLHLSSPPSSAIAKVLERLDQIECDLFTNGSVFRGSCFVAFALIKAICTWGAVQVCLFLVASSRNFRASVNYTAFLAIVSYPTRRHSFSMSLTVDTWNLPVDWVLFLRLFSIRAISIYISIIEEYGRLCLGGSPNQLLTFRALQAIQIEAPVSLVISPAEFDAEYGDDTDGTTSEMTSEEPDIESPSTINIAENGGQDIHVSSIDFSSFDPIASSTPRKMSGVYTSDSTRAEVEDSLEDYRDESPILSQSLRETIISNDFPKPSYLATGLGILGMAEDNRDKIQQQRIQSKVVRTQKVSAQFTAADLLANIMASPAREVSQQPRHWSRFFTPGPRVNEPTVCGPQPIQRPAPAPKFLGIGLGRPAQHWEVYSRRMHYSDSGVDLPDSEDEGDSLKEVAERHALKERMAILYRAREFRREMNTKAWTPAFDAMGSPVLRQV